jgi:hypothetical protein
MVGDTEAKGPISCVLDADARTDVKSGVQFGDWKSIVKYLQRRLWAGEVECVMPRAGEAEGLAET